MRYWYSVTIYYITVSNFFVTETKIIKLLFCAILSSYKTNIMNKK